MNLLTFAIDLSEPVFRVWRHSLYQKVPSAVIYFILHTHDRSAAYNNEHLRQNTAGYCGIRRN